MIIPDGEMDNLKLLFSYLKTYWITASLLGYMVVSTTMLSMTSIDLTIPCVIRYCTGEKCYGCGLTTASMHLLRLDLQSAFEANPLIFILLPWLIFLIVRHWITFKKSNPAKVTGAN